jgi:hypothetical protein
MPPVGTKKEGNQSTNSGEEHNISIHNKIIITLVKSNLIYS